MIWCCTLKTCSNNDTKRISRRTPTQTTRKLGQLDYRAVVTDAHKFSRCLDADAADGGWAQ